MFGLFTSKQKSEPIASHPGFTAAREFDELVDRIVSGELLPGDAMLAQQQPILSRDRDRISGVRIRMEKAGNAQEWSRANELMSSTGRRLDEITSANQPRITALEAELAKLRGEINQAAVPARKAADSVAVMKKNHDLLQSTTLLPPVINQEVANLVNRSGDRVEWNRLSREIAKHRTDGHEAEAQESEAELAALEASWPSAIKQDLETLRSFYTSTIR